MLSIQQQISKEFTPSHPIAIASFYCGWPLPCIVLDVWYRRQSLWSLWMTSYCYLGPIIMWCNASSIEDCHGIRGVGSVKSIEDFISLLDTVPFWLRGRWDVCDVVVLSRCNTLSLIFLSRRLLREVYWRLHIVVVVVVVVGKRRIDIS